MEESDIEGQGGSEDEKAGLELFSRVAQLLRRRRAGGLPGEGTSLESATDELEEHLTSHPESVPALRLLAECAQGLGKFERARGYISRAELLDPWSLEILIISESLYETDAGSARRRPGEPPRLHSDLNSGVVNADSLIEKAMGSFRLGDLDRAYTLAKLAYLITPESEHHLLDVLAVGSSFDPERTLVELILLESEHPRTGYLYLALGSISNVLGRYDEAASWLAAGVDLSSKDPYLLAMLYNEMAYVMAKREINLNRCVALARAALEMFPNKKANGFIRDTLGIAYLKCKEVKKAIRNLREAVSKDPTVIPRFHLALAQLMDGDPAGAQAELKIIADSRTSLESPHVEETAILDRVQANIGRLEHLLNLGGAGDIQDAIEILSGLI
jgi:tetratricopeptide (TPR) repeat protein